MSSSSMMLKTSEGSPRSSLLRLGAAKAQTTANIHPLSPVRPTVHTMSPDSRVMAFMPPQIMGMRTKAQSANHLGLLMQLLRSYKGGIA